MWLSVLSTAFDQQAHADFAWKATRDTLQRMGYADASRLAGSVTGRVRVRLEVLTG